MKTVSAYCGSRDNNFNLLRFLAALSVVVSHAAVVVNGPLAPEPLMAETGYTVGHHAVSVFFIISGFLIAQSLERSPDIFEYAAARILRLVPGLVIAAFVTAFLIGPMVTEVGLQDYFADWHVLAYVPLTGGLIVDNLQLPGVFASVPSANELNTPLWTLRWEAFAYAGIAMLGMVGLMATHLRFASVCAGFLAAYLLLTAFTDLRETVSPIEHVLRLGFCFLLGSAFYVYRSRVPVTVLAFLPLWTLAVLLRETILYQPLLISALGYTVFWLAYVPGGVIRRFNELGDSSYGIYIYGFPLQQTVILALPALSPAQSFFVTVPFILSAAFLSFYLVEKPALAQRCRLACILRTPFQRDDGGQTSTSPDPEVARQMS